MSGVVYIKRQLLAVIFAWPLAVLAGWMTSQVIHRDWPLAFFPVVWLCVLFYTLRSYASWRD